MASQQATKESFASNAAILAKFRDLDQHGKSAFMSAFRHYTVTEH